MNTLIVYGTKHGCTENCARMLAEKILGAVDLCNLKKSKAPDLSHYDQVIIGGSIYIGQIQKEVRKYCWENLELLKNKKLGLFSCCMREGKEAETQLKDSFPKELFELAVAKECFGGAYDFKKMKFLERLIIKKVANVDHDLINIQEDRINKFAQALNTI